MRKKSESKSNVPPLSERAKSRFSSLPRWRSASGSSFDPSLKATERIAFTLQRGLISLLSFCILSWLCLKGASSPKLFSSIQSADGPGMLSSIGMTVALIVGVMLLNGLFTAAETAIELLRPRHVRHFKEQENERAVTRLQKLVDGRASFVAATTFGTQLCRFALFILVLSLAAALTLKADAAEQISNVVLVTVLIGIPLLLVNLVMELIPKSYAALHPHRVGIALYGFANFFGLIFAVPARLVTYLAELITHRFGGKASFAIGNTAEEEIKTLVESAKESGEIEVDERELLHSVFEFTDTVVREVMTPRVDIDALSVTAEPQEILHMIKNSGHSRIPLYEDTDDAIVGIVHAKDLLVQMLGDGEVDVRKFMRLPIFVPENKNLHDLLQELRVSRSQMAVVQDEFGGTSGIVTIEDIVEELVGDIVDEYDEEEPAFVVVDGGHLVDAKTHVDDVNRALGTAFDSSEFNTIGGYVFGLFGRQPNYGETIEEDGTCFEVAELDGRRITKLRLSPASMVEVAE